MTCKNDTQRANAAKCWKCCKCCETLLVKSEKAAAAACAATPPQHLTASHLISPSHSRKFLDDKHETKNCICPLALPPSPLTLSLFCNPKVCRKKRRKTKNRADHGAPNAKASPSPSPQLPVPSCRPPATLKKARTHTHTFSRGRFGQHAKDTPQKRKDPQQNPQTNNNKKWYKRRSCA